MLVVEDAKALVLKLDTPARVLDSIASSRLAKIQGQEVVLVPHKLDEVRVLRNLGIRAPSPILHYYGWPGNFNPFSHQRQTSAFLTMHPKALVLNEIGTGKTASALWSADYLMNAGAVKKVLIISPLSTLERVWGDAIYKDMIHRKAVVLHGTAKRRKQRLKADVDFYIVNHDGFGIIAADAMGMFDLVIVDEAAVYRNTQSNKYKRLNKWMQANPETRLWLMTGTPTPNEPTDAWSLSQLVGNPSSPRTFGRFRDQVMYRDGMYTYLPRAGSVETVKNVLQPAVRYSREECLDLPDTMTSFRGVDLTPEQKTYHDKMMKDLIVEAAQERVTGTQITAVTEAVKLQKLVQIACGVAYNDKGENVELDCAPRIAATTELVEQVGGKVIIFVPLTGTLHMLERELSKHWTVGVINGQVPASKRNVIFHNFQNSDTPHILLAHPGTMAHGLTLTVARTIIWYGPITSNETYVQANGRIERIGKQFTSNVIHIAATKLEYAMYNRLKKKQRTQGLLLELIQAEMESNNG